MGPASGTPPGGLTTEVLGHGTVAHRFKIQVDGMRVSTNRPVDFTVAHLTFAPGGTTGWHVHPGPVLVVVKSGTITKYAADCSATRFTAGRAFVERGPRDLNMVLNEARTHAETIVTFITRWERRLATTPPHHPDANP